MDEFETKKLLNLYRRARMKELSGSESYHSATDLIRTAPSKDLDEIVAILTGRRLQRMGMNMGMGASDDLVKFTEAVEEQGKGNECRVIQFPNRGSQ